MRWICMAVTLLVGRRIIAYPAKAPPPGRSKAIRRWKPEIYTAPYVLLLRRFMRRRESDRKSRYLLLHGSLLSPPVPSSAHSWIPICFRSTPIIAYWYYVVNIFGVRFRYNS